MGAMLDRVSWTLALLMAVTLGLAPFMPEPHVWEKLKMLASGELSRPIDIVDLMLHGLPWLILIAKAGRAMLARPPSGQ